MSDVFNARLRERLRNTGYVNPTRLERRLKRTGYDALELRETLNPSSGKNPIIRTLIIIVYLLGIIAAMIPTLLYFAITIIPAYLLYVLFSAF